MANATLSHAGSDIVPKLTALYELDEKVRTISKPLRVILAKFAENPDQERHLAANAITELEEHWSERAARGALEEIGIQDYTLEYNSPYNGKSPRHTPNDKGADLTVRLPDGTEVPVEVEQRKQGYTMRPSYDSEVRDKLPQNGVYAWFNGYQRKQFDEVCEWANLDRIRVVNLEPLPYHEVIEDVYHFDLEEIAEWLRGVYSRLVAALARHLRTLLREKDDNGDDDDHIMESKDNNVDVMSICPNAVELRCAKSVGSGWFGAEPERIWRRVKLRFAVMREFSACINDMLVRPTRSVAATDELHIRQGLGYRIAALRNFGLALVSFGPSYGGSP